MFAMENRKIVTTALAGAALASAMVTSGASAMPDSGDHGLRSPAAVDSARPAGDPPSTQPTEDHVFPGLAERARGSGAPNPAAANESQQVVGEPSSSGGFDMPSAAIGAATGTGTVILLLAAGGLARRLPLRAS
jgi:hypothetical protein